MPKISAPTVAEHRIAQRSALLAATEQLLLEVGLAGVTPRSVAERAGLARSSFYEYFASRDDALAAVAIASFEQWAEEIEDVLSSVPDEERLRAYIQATMRMTADGKHSIAATLQQAELSPSSYDDIMALHTTLFEPIASLLAAAGIPDAQAHATLVQGLLGAGVQLVSHGTSPDAAAALITQVVENGLPRA